ncbi:MAG: hypothetical protein IJO08_00455 [Clostridia bacterium]|nr:hypothetical protein [Clostridia bacterium]
MKNETQNKTLELSLKLAKNFIWIQVGIYIIGAYLILNFFDDFVLVGSQALFILLFFIAFPVIKKSFSKCPEKDYFKLKEKINKYIIITTLVIIVIAMVYMFFGYIDLKESIMELEQQNMEEVMEKNPLVGMIGGLVSFYALLVFSYAPHIIIITIIVTFLEYLLLSKLVLFLVSKKYCKAAQNAIEELQKEELLKEDNNLDENMN